MLLQIIFPFKWHLVVGVAKYRGLKIVCYMQQCPRAYRDRLAHEGLNLYCSSRPKDRLVPEHRPLRYFMGSKYYTNWVARPEVAISSLIYFFG